MLQHVQDYGHFDPNTIDQAIADYNTLVKTLLLLLARMVKRLGVCVSNRAEPIEIKVAQLPEDDVADHLDDVDFSLGGELTIDLVVGIELCQDSVENT